MKAGALTSRPASSSRRARAGAGGGLRVGGEAAEEVERIAAPIVDGPQQRGLRVEHTADRLDVERLERREEAGPAHGSPVSRA
jgi:hypothetical protein